LLNRKPKPVIAVHGGAGRWHPDHSQPAIRSVKKSAQAGFDLLRKGGSAVDAVTEAVVLLEDLGEFNAGAGSALTIEKRLEMEASIMDGRTLSAGAAAMLSNVRNPVRVARLVMEKTDHVFIAGVGAEKLARMFNLETREPEVSAKLEQYEAQLKCLRAGEFGLPKLAKLIETNSEIFQLETVGAVALDTEGNVAAATSTGGYPLKLAGRIGDSPSIGCGTYADNMSGACSATGVGELAIRLVVAKAVCDRMEAGKTAQEAVEDAIALVKRRMSGVYNDMGLVAVDIHGRLGAAHCSPNLCWAYMNEEISEPEASLTARFIQ